MRLASQWRGHYSGNHNQTIWHFLRALLRCQQYAPGVAHGGGASPGNGGAGSLPGDAIAPDAAPLLAAAAGGSAGGRGGSGAAGGAAAPVLPAAPSVPGAAPALLPASPPSSEAELSSEGAAWPAFPKSTAERGSTPSGSLKDESEGMSGAGAGTSGAGGGSSGFLSSPAAASCVAGPACHSKGLCCHRRGSPGRLKFPRLRLHALKTHLLPALLHGNTLQAAAEASQRVLEHPHCLHRSFKCT